MVNEKNTEIGKVEQKEAQVIADSVSRHDHERYLMTLFAPREKQVKLQALYAMNFEIARIPEVVQEAMIGEIRLQWWRDAIREIYEGKQSRDQKTPVLSVLSAAIHQDNLPQHEFEAMFDARAGDLYKQVPRDIKDLEAYVDATSSSLFRLSLHILSPNDQPENLRKAACEAGLAWALCGLLRSIPFHAAQGRHYIPLSLLQAGGVSEKEILAGQPTPQLQEIVRHLHQNVTDHVDRAESTWPLLPTAVHPPFVLLGLARDHLKRLQKADYNPFSPKLAKPLIFPSWRMISYARRLRPKAKVKE